MRLIILGSVALPIPPLAQGGTEWIAYHQAKGLSEKGHEVILVGAGGTAENFKDTKVKVIEVGEGGLVEGGSTQIKFDPSTMESSRKLREEAVRLGQVSQILIDQKDNYDVILNNMRGEAVFLPVAKMLGKPFASVMHLNLFSNLAEMFKSYQANIITISDSQREGFEDLNFLATIYNGVDSTKFAFNPNPEDYLLMMGSIARHKNQAAAIKVAKAVGMPLVLAGKIGEKEYFDEIKGEIDGENIKHVGEIGFDDKIKLYQGAKAFLFPISWNEPFGLVMIEAMSCGVPVIAFRKGSTSEVVLDSVTGFVVEDEQMMIEAVGKIDQIKREDCRKRVEEMFTVTKMIDDYEKALQKLTTS